MKKLALFIALTLLASAFFTFGAYAAVDGVIADAVPANYGVIADFNPEAITEDIDIIIGDQVPVEISGSKGFTSLAGHTSGTADTVSVALKEENGEKFVRFANTANYTSGKYSQLYFNLDTNTFTAAEEFYFTITLRLSGAFTCTDGKDRAVLARLVDGVQNNCVIVTRDDLANKNFSDWTTITFSFTPANAPYVMRIITFCDPTDYIDIKDFKVYAASVAPTTEAPVTEAPVTEAPATEAPATQAPATDAPVVDTTVAPETPEDTPATGDHTFVIFAACLVAVAAVAVLTKKKVRE